MKLRTPLLAPLCFLSLMVAGCISGTVLPLSDEDAGGGGSSVPPGTGGSPGTGGTRGTGGVFVSGSGGFRGTGGAIVRGTGGALVVVDAGRDTGARDVRDAGAGDVRDAGPGDVRSDAASADGGTATFTDVYNMLLTPYCSGAACHNPDAQRGISFSTKATAYTSVRNNVQPGSATTSTLYTVIMARGMPPAGSPAPSAQLLALLASWINAGALNN